MTKKHFEAIAADFMAVRDLQGIQKSTEGRAALDILAMRISQTCAEVNPRFDKARFLRACGA